MIAHIYLHTHSYDFDTPVFGSKSENAKIFANRNYIIRTGNLTEAAMKVHIKLKVERLLNMKEKNAGLIEEWLLSMKENVGLTEEWLLNMKKKCWIS